MDYQDFEKLYSSGGVVFHLALELLMETGREAIQALSDQELEAALMCRMSSLFVTERVAKTVKAVKEFTALSSVELFTFAARCGIRLENEPPDTPGVCPLCGGKLVYGEDASASRPHAVGWTCEGCGATGKEAYREVFDCHYDVLDSSGKLVVERKNLKG